MNKLIVKDIIVSYELDTKDVPTFIICTSDGEKSTILKVISGENGVVSVSKLIEDYYLNNQ